jgi:hypothetical protein
MRHLEAYDFDSQLQLELSIIKPPITALNCEKYGIYVLRLGALSGMVRDLIRCPLVDIERWWTKCY